MSLTHVPNTPSDFFASFVDSSFVIGLLIDGPGGSGGIVGRPTPGGGGGGSVTNPDGRGGGPPKPGGGVWLSKTDGGGERKHYCWSREHH